MIRAIDWLNVFVTPIIAASFTYDIAVGNPAGYGVWAWAFTGLLAVFVAAVRSLSRN